MTNTPPPGPTTGGPDAANPYASAAQQAPYGQNPYGQAPADQNPYAQNPYGGQAPQAQAPYPPQGQYPQGQQHPQSPYIQPPHPQGPYAQAPQPGHPGQPGYAHPGVPDAGCRVCGSPHTVNMSVRAHMGILILMRFFHQKGPFCRTCGRAMVRAMTTKTLVQGWWSPLSLVIFSPFTLIWNLIAAIRFSKLPPSEPAPGRQTLDEGPPVHARPLAYVAILPALWAVWVITNIIADVTS
ncbi:hypothetical protein [Streptomyces sp. RerS4]|uniref:hypothetical protein n=1 Tax=Streptomyces sp. RerS4 TaxID=2942449 RepID=UPI00201C3552|nr:hypothetical protein [Streptomyces sp. RerS4]UQX02417.1 hypothetical protein M4D82_19430 [Streptomyces sp. RerS4]